MGISWPSSPLIFFVWSRSERHVFLDFPCRQCGDLKDGDFPLVTYQHWNWREGFAWHFRLGVTSDTSEFFPMKNGSFDWCTSYFRYGRDYQPASLFLYCTAYHVSNPDWFQPLANWWLLLPKAYRPIPVAFHPNFFNQGFQWEKTWPWTRTTFWAIPMHDEYYPPWNQQQKQPKMDGFWRRSGFLLGFGLFSGAFAVSFKEANQHHQQKGNQLGSCIGIIVMISDYKDPH